MIIIIISKIKTWLPREERCRTGVQDRKFAARHWRRPNFAKHKQTEENRWSVKWLIPPPTCRNFFRPSKHTRFHTHNTNFLPPGNRTGNRKRYVDAIITFGNKFHTEITHAAGAANERGECARENGGKTRSRERRSRDKHCGGYGMVEHYTERHSPTVGMPRARWIELGDMFAFTKARRSVD